VVSTATIDGCPGARTSYVARDRERAGGADGDDRARGALGQPARRGLGVVGASQELGLARVEDERPGVLELGRRGRPCARVGVADRRVERRPRRSEREPRQRQHGRRRRDRRELRGRHLLARVERGHRALALGREHCGHRAARDGAPRPADALLGQRGAQEVALGVAADRRDQRRAEPEPGGADRRDRPAAGRAEQVVRVPLLAARRQGFEPRERQVEEGGLAARELHAHAGNASASAGRRAR